MEENEWFLGWQDNNGGSVSVKKICLCGQFLEFKQ